MGKKSLEKFFDSLILPLWEELYFYISDKNITTEFLESYDVIELRKFFNKIYVIDHKQGPLLYKEERGIAGLLLKSSFLETNIFNLLEKKRKLQADEFTFILEKYFKQVETCFQIATWTNDNLESQATLKVDDITRTVFELQFKTIKDHFKKLIKYFYPNKEELLNTDLNLIKTLETYFPELLGRYKKDEDASKINEQQIQSKSTKIVDASKEGEKQFLITEEQAEDFILESVFGIT